jgi:hypothetical protein
VVPLTAVPLIEVPLTGVTVVLLRVVVVFDIPLLVPLAAVPFGPKSAGLIVILPKAKGEIVLFKASGVGSGVSELVVADVVVAKEESEVDGST